MPFWGWRDRLDAKCLVCGHFMSRHEPRPGNPLIVECTLCDCDDGDY